MFFARLPTTTMGILTTLYVVQELDGGYAQAGLVGSATLLGTALGAPLVGRMVDRYGMRPVLAFCGPASAM
jgi:MFS family permease